MIELSAHRHFRLGEARLSEQISASLPPRLRDFLHTAMAVYVVDRLHKRNGRNDINGPSRPMSVTVTVSELDFWRSHEVNSLIPQALELLSEDSWKIQFEYEAPKEKKQRYLAFPFDEQATVCLYSGGLDSAAGLATVLDEDRQPRIAVTAQHQAGQAKLVRRQLDTLRHVFDQPISSVMVRTTLRDPPPAREQELTQRCRSFLFTAIAGVVACEAEASTIEVYENGVGAVNLPLMAGMLTGGRSTKSAHPEFMRLMSQLLSKVAERPMHYDLRFRHKTKADLTKSLAASESLANVARKTVSCVHYPRRVPGPAKQCGVCPGCIGRRQSLIVAGIHESGHGYQYDVFGRASSVNAIPLDSLGYLRATILQVMDLISLDRESPLPLETRSHLYGSRIVKPGEDLGPTLRVLKRYRDEWLGLIADGQRKGLEWAKWFGPTPPPCAERSVA